jgi:hypothetical protein
MFEKKLSRLPVRSAAKSEKVGSLKADGYTCPNCGDARDAAEFAGLSRRLEDAVEKLKGNLPE